MPVLKAGICPSASIKFIEALSGIGIKTVEDFIICDCEKASAAAKVPYRDMVATRCVLLAQYAAMPVTGSSLFKHTLESAAILSTGCSILDEMLDGGLYAMELTELVGEMASGKSQVCLGTTASVVMTTQQNVLYIDTCGSFSAERVVEMISVNGAQDADQEARLSRIRCMTAFDIYELMTVLDVLRSHICDRKDEFYTRLKLVVVDSLPAVVSPVLGGLQVEGLSLLTQVGLTLKSLANEYSLAVLVTNNMVSGGGGRKVGLGRHWQHAPHTRVLVEKVGGHHSASLIKSSRLTTANQRVEFIITDSGLMPIPSSHGPI